MTPEDLWLMILRFLKFSARLPLAALVICVAGFLSFVLFMALFRATEWMWAHWLSTAWN